MKTVKEVSDLTGVSVRTLHHYDAIGLLKPTRVTEAGYRLYDDTALRRLQTILLFRQLQFPLKEIKDILEEDKMNSSIYIMLDTLYYLKKGGRITPAAAALGTLLKIKPVLQIQGEKLDAFAKARTVNQGKTIMLNAIRSDMEKRFGGATPENIWLQIAYTKDLDAALAFKQEVEAAFPGFDIAMAPLSLSVACHIGPGSLAVACCKKLQV